MTDMAQKTDVTLHRHFGKVIRQTIDLLLVLVPLFTVLYFLFDPKVFDAFTAWLVRFL
jgi:hypothetical protein